VGSNPPAAPMLIYGSHASEKQRYSS